MTVSGTREMSNSTNGYGDLARRFTWISSYDNPSALELMMLDRSMSEFYSKTEPFEYHSTASELNQTLLVAALLTSVICYLFLGSWSSTFNVLVSIPTSIV